MNAPAPTAIRVNLLKTTVEQCAAGLADEGIPSRRTSSSPAGLVLNKRINASASPTFRQGGFEFQDEGSQLLSLLPDPQSGETIVDACAGGGGKTLHLAMLMKNTGKLFAIDVDERRLNSIRIRLERAGVTICDLLLAGRDRERIAALQGQADAVLVDAPCSGVGTLRRNPGAKLTVNEVFIERMARTQRDVLTSYASLVKPGGRLVYSTCTLLRQENEEVVERFLGLHPEFSLLSATGALRRHDVVVESATEYLLLLPHRTSTDGFFAAVMQRGA